MKEQDYSAIEGLVILIEEKQKGVMDHTGKDIEYDNSGKIVIYNNTGSPLFDLEIHLENTEKTSLRGRKTLEVGIVKHEEGANVHTINYSIVDVPKAVQVTEEFKLPADLPKPIAYINEKVDLPLVLSVANKWTAKFETEIRKELPHQIEIVNVPTPNIGVLEKSDNAINFKDLQLDIGDRLELSIETKLAPTTSDAFRSGKIYYKYRGENTTISNLEIKEVTGILKITSYIDKVERSAERGVWDCYVVVENPTKAEIIVSPEAQLHSGMLLEEEVTREYKWNLIKQHPGLRGHDIIVFEPVHVAPGETKRIGPFTLKSDEEPKVSMELKTKIVAKIFKKLEGEFEIEDVEIPVFSGILGKTVKVLHPSYIHGLTEDQLAAHLEETIDIETYLENTGSAKADYIKFVEEIPEDILPPKRTSVRAFLRKGENEIVLPSETIDISLDPDTLDAESKHNLVVEVKDLYTRLGEFFERNDRIYLRYQIVAKDPKPNKTYELPSQVYMALAPGTKPYVRGLDTIPRIQTLEAARKVVKSKEVLVTEARDEFVVVIVLKNEGDLPVKDYEFIDKVPLTFELLEEKIKPEPSDISEVRDGLILKWHISEIPAKSEERIEYTVRGRAGYKVSELYRIYDEA